MPARSVTSCGARSGCRSGRVEEIPEVGNYITYQILDDSILIVRSAPDTIKAFYNVCSHRGRRLVDTPAGAHHAHGKQLKFVCGFHAWTYNLEGQCTHIMDKENWEGALTDNRTRLGKVQGRHVGRMDLDQPRSPQRVPCATISSPRRRCSIPSSCRTCAAGGAAGSSSTATGKSPWRRSTRPTTSRARIRSSCASATSSAGARPQGKHSHIGYDAPKGLDENKAKLRLGAGNDPRKSTAEMQLYTWEQVNTNTTKTLVDAALRLVDELPEGTPADKVLKHWLDSARRDDAARGVIWPTVAARACGQERHRVADISRTSRSATRSTTCFATARGPMATTLTSASSRPRCTSFIPKGKEPQTEWEYLPVDHPTWGSVLRAGLCQHGRRAAGHEERRIPRNLAESESRGGGHESAPQPRHATWARPDPRT